MKKTFLIIGSVFIMLSFMAFRCQKGTLAGKPQVTDFTWSPSNPKAPATVNFTATTFLAVEYSWDFGDGNTSMLEKPSNRYSKAGTYLVNLTVRNPKAPEDIQYAFLTKTIVVK